MSVEMQDSGFRQPNCLTDMLGKNVEPPLWMNRLAEAIGDCEACGPGEVEKPVELVLDLHATGVLKS